MQMDKTLLEQHLALAERHVTQGEATIARQRQIVERMELGGQNACEARHLLALFLQLQKIHIADRDRLRRELGGRAPNPS